MYIACLLQVLSERDAVVRKNSILLASAESDTRLSNAMLQIEELSKNLEEEKRLHSQEVT